MLEAPSGFEPENGAFAELCLTTWLPRPQQQPKLRPTFGGRKLNFGSLSLAILVPVRLRARGGAEFPTRRWRWDSGRLGVEKVPLKYCRKLSIHS